MSSLGPLGNPLARPRGKDGETRRPSPWDDLPIHQTADSIATTTPDLPGFAERFYFNVLDPEGPIVAVLGLGIYPGRGVGEGYLCRIDGTRQVNLRVSCPMAHGSKRAPSRFELECAEPLRRWRVDIAEQDHELHGEFTTKLEPYAFDLFDIPSDTDGGEYDLFRHYVGVGSWSAIAGDGFDAARRYRGVRDRTWGVRTRRVRCHNWYVFDLGESYLTVVHQERADGSILFSEAGICTANGAEIRLEVADHDLTYDRDDRQIVGGEMSLRGEGGEARLSFERVGTGIRLAGAGYDDRQGERGEYGVARDDYELADPQVAARTGRGTIDAGARATLSGAWSGEGFGVVETAIARDHVRYGSQIS